MGKIVRSAAFGDTAYVLNVPRVENEPPEPTGRERVDRFDRFDPFGDEAVAHAPAAEFVAQTPMVDWDAVRTDAEALIDRAESDAGALLAQAESAALELVNRAQTHVEAIESEARERGFAEGRASAQEAARAELEPQLATLADLIASVRAHREAMFGAAEPELVRLALEIAERVIHIELAANPNVVVENTRQALTRLLAREVVTVRVNPADLDAIREHRDAIMASSDIEHLRVIEDQRVDRGGVLIETESGTIDAKISTQLREARRAILSDDSIALGPSAEGELHPPAQAS